METVSAGSQEVNYESNRDNVKQNEFPEINVGLPKIIK
jgi:hypothetical protein